MSDRPPSSRPDRSTLAFSLLVLLKALALFTAANLLFAAVYPMEALGRISAYNRVFPGRLRLPYGDYPARAYNLSLYNLEAMFAAHQIAAGPKPAEEYRVVLVGDSSTWGFLLPADQTLAAQLNALDLSLPDGRQLRAYNLGYPVMSLTKDLLILTYAQRYQPDLIVWPVTLESLPYDKQLFPPLLQNNAPAVRRLIDRYGLRLDPASPELRTPTFAEQTLLGARRPLADLFRLQVYGILWAATGIDQDIPAQYDPPQSDLPADLTFHNLQPTHLTLDDLVLDVLSAGVQAAGDTPVLLVNEPIFVSAGANRDVRYNFFYPRWAYDDYRRILAETARAHGWTLIDAWDLLPPEEFTNSAVHYTAWGARRLAERIAPTILALASGQTPP